MNNLNLYPKISFSIVLNAVVFFTNHMYGKVSVYSISACLHCELRLLEVTCIEPQDVSH